MNLSANGFPVLTWSLYVPWSGVWLLDGAYDAPDVPPLDSPIVLTTTEGQSLVGTVDPDPEKTIKFGERVHLGVLGGGGGWGKPVLPKAYQSDAGVALASVVSTTAAEVREIASVLVPETIGTDFFRVGGEPAAQVLDGRSWWVGFDGVTRIGPRPSLRAPASLEVLEWDEDTGVITAACDGLVEPGTVIVDERVGAPKIVRDVLLRVEEDKIRATLWCVDVAPQGEAPAILAAVVGDLARKAIGADWLKLYEYRVLAMRGDRIAAAPVDPTKHPGLSLVSCWNGAAGVKHALKPGSMVLVGFRGGPTAPYVAAYMPPDAPGWLPLSTEIDAETTVTIGATAAGGVLVGAGTEPVALASVVAEWMTQAAVACAANIPTIVLPATPLNLGSTKLKTS